MYGLVEFPQIRIFKKALYIATLILWFIITCAQRKSDQCYNFYDISNYLWERAANEKHFNLILVPK